LLPKRLAQRWGYNLDFESSISNLLEQPFTNKLNQPLTIPNTTSAKLGGRHSS